eukprot:UN32287
MQPKSPEEVKDMSKGFDDRYGLATRGRENADSTLGDVKQFDWKGASCIDSMTGGGITVSGVRYEHSVLIFPTFVLLWRPRKVSDITVESLFYLLYFILKYDIYL